jgi:hypothetical protein
MTQSKVKEIIQSEFISKYRTPAKINAVAKAASKFLNKYKNAYYVSVIDACLQSYSTDECLSTYLEKEKNLFI